MYSAKVLSLLPGTSELLHQPSEKVTDIDQSIVQLSHDLLETIKHHHGLAIAAVQVGILKKVIVTNIPKELDTQNLFPMLTSGPVTLINAEIIQTSDECASYTEGCLSYHGVFADITRPNSIIIRYQDIENKTHTINIHNSIIAACMQHEIDHTNGITFLDRLPKSKNLSLLKKYKNSQIKYRK